MRIKMTRGSENVRLTAETVGAVLGLIAGGIASILLGGLVIYWILGAIGLGSLTYGQVVGLLAIWEIVKPRTDTK